MDMEIEKRKTELERLSNVSAIEALILELEIGESKVSKIRDVESYQCLRIRLKRIKNSFGICFSSVLTENYVIVTRIENDLKDNTRVGEHNSST